MKKRIFKNIFYLLILILLVRGSFAKSLDGPDCSKGWPLNMAFSKLKNLGIYESADWEADKINSKRVFSVREGKRYKQMYEVNFNFKKEIKVFVIHYADNTECSLTEPEVYIVNQTK